MKIRTLGILASLLACGSALAQGGAGNPKFDQPKDPAKETPARSNDGRYDLRPRFERGQRIKLKLEVTNLASQPAISIDPLDDPSDPKKPSPRQPANKPKPGTKPEIEQTKSKIEFGIVMNVTDVDSDGNSVVDLVFETLKVSVDGAGMKEEFDSTKPPKPTKPGDVDFMSAALKPMVGTKMTMHVDRSGNISSVTGGDGFAAMGQIAPGGGSMPQLIGPIFTIKKGDGYARIGEAWENQDKLASGVMGDFKMTTRHTLASVSGKDAKIDLKGKMEAGSMAPGASTFQIKDSSYSGKYTWDLARGMIKDMSTRMSVKIEHRLQDTPVEVTSETTTKLTRID